MTLPSGIINLLKDELNDVDWKGIHESIGGKIYKYKYFAKVAGMRLLFVCMIL